MQQPWELSFLRKCSKLNVNLANANANANANAKKKKKKKENIFCVWNNCIWNCCYQLSLLRKDYQLLGVNGLRNSPKFLYIKRDRPFPTELPSEWSINMVNVLSFRLQQCSGPFTLLLVEVSSETRLFGHLSNFYLRSL